MNEQLYQRVRGIRALNQVFQTHLQQRFDVVQAYIELLTGARKLLHDTSLLVTRGRTTSIPDLTDPPLGDL